jgi:small GTP-binding protein
MYDATFKIIIFGDKGTGKTELTQRFLTHLFVSDQTMTIGVDFEVKSLSVDGKKVKLQIWDFGGEERFRFLLPTYVRGAKGGIFVYNPANFSSIAHIDDWISVITKEIRAVDVFPIIAVGIHSEGENIRQLPYEDCIKIVRSRGFSGIIECNTITGENVKKALEALTRLMLSGSGARVGERRQELLEYDYFFKVILLAHVSENEKIYLKAFFKDLLREYYNLTIGVEFLHKIIRLADKKIKLQIWNIDSKKSSSLVRQGYLEGVNGAVLIINVTNDTKLSEIRRKVLSFRNDYKLGDKSFPIIVLGIREKLVDKQLRFETESITIGKLIGADAFIQCSLKAKETVEEAFEIGTKVFIEKLKEKSDRILMDYRRTSRLKSTKNKWKRARLKITKLLLKIKGRRRRLNH